MPRKRIKIAYGRYRGKWNFPWPVVFLALGGLVLLVDLVIVRMFGGAYFLFQFLLGCSAVLFLYGGLRWVGEAGIRGAKVCKIARHAMEIGFGVWLLSFIVLETVIASGSKTNAVPDAEYLVVLGAGVSGEIPSPAYAVRLDAAVAYLRENPGTTAVVTGGQGPGEAITEAEAGQRWLTARGIDPERILLEDASHYTNENIRYALEHIPKGSVTVMATNEFHLFRARWIARKHGLVDYGLAAPTPYAYLKYTYYLREYFSVALMFLGRY